MHSCAEANSVSVLDTASRKRSRPHSGRPGGEAEHHGRLEYAAPQTELRAPARLSEGVSPRDPSDQRLQVAVRTFSGVLSRFAERDVRRSPDLEPRPSGR